MERDPASEMLCFLVSIIPDDKVQKPSDSECYILSLSSLVIKMNMQTQKVRCYVICRLQKTILAPRVKISNFDFHYPRSGAGIA
jgi:hypothetical protein